MSTIRLKDLPASMAAQLAPQQAKRKRQVKTPDAERSGVLSVPRPPLELLPINANIAYNTLNNPKHLEAAKADNPVAYDRLLDVLRDLAALRAALEGEGR